MTDDDRPRLVTRRVRRRRSRGSGPRTCDRRRPRRCRPRARGPPARRPVTSRRATRSFTSASPGSRSEISPDPEAPSPTPVSTRTAGTVLGGNGSGRDGGNGSSGPTPSAFLFDGSPEAVDLGTPERSGAVRSVPSEPAEDPTETPAPAPMRISAAMPRVHPEPTPEPDDVLEPNKPGSSPAKRQTPEFLPRRRHPRFEPSKLPPPIGGTLSLVDRIRSDGDEVMAAEFMETVAPGLLPRDVHPIGTRPIERIRKPIGRTSGRLDVASSPPSRMRNLSDACRKPVGHRDPTRFRRPRRGTARPRRGPQRPGRCPNALPPGVSRRCADGARRRPSASSSGGQIAAELRTVAATRGDGLDASVDPEDDAGGAGTCMDTSCMRHTQGLGDDDKPGSKRPKGTGDCRGDSRAGRERVAQCGDGRGEDDGAGGGQGCPRRASGGRRGDEARRDFVDDVGHRLRRGGNGGDGETGEGVRVQLEGKKRGAALIWTGRRSWTSLALDGRIVSGRRGSRTGATAQKAGARVMADLPALQAPGTAAAALRSGGCRD